MFIEKVKKNFWMKFRAWNHLVALQTNSYYIEIRTRK